MSHVFISYKSEDQFQLQALIDVLKKADIPYWYDVGIRAGDDWRDEIDLRIEQAFALVVIVTDKAAVSHYVTYEWSRALGQGTPVIPLSFQEALPVNLHPRLRAFEHLSCYPQIDAKNLVDELRMRQRKSPLVRFTESAILDIMFPFRILMNSLTLFELMYVKQLAVPDNGIADLLFFASDTLKILNRRQLPAFWVQSSHALAPNQRRDFDRLASLLEELEEPLAKAVVEVHVDTLSYDRTESIAAYFLSDALTEWSAIEKILSTLSYVYYEKPFPTRLITEISEISSLPKENPGFWTEFMFSLEDAEEFATPPIVQAIKTVAHGIINQLDN